MFYCCLVIRTNTTKKILLAEKHRWYLWKYVRLYITAIEFSPLSGTFWLIIILWIKNPRWPRSLLWHEELKKEHPMGWLKKGTYKEWRCCWYEQTASRSIALALRPPSRPPLRGAVSALLRLLRLLQGCPEQGCDYPSGPEAKNALSKEQSATHYRGVQGSSFLAAQLQKALREAFQTVISPGI